MTKSDESMVKSDAGPVKGSQNSDADTQNSDLAGLIHPEDNSFLCFGCLARKDMAQISDDPRYCLPCCRYLQGEAQELPSGRKPRWVPKHYPGRATTRAENAPSGVPMRFAETAEDVTKLTPCPNTQRVLLQQKHAGGRPQRLELPHDRIKELRQAGLSCRDISAELEQEGYHISHMTINRMLKKEEPRLDSETVKAE